MMISPELLLTDQVSFDHWEDVPVASLYKLLHTLLIAETQHLSHMYLNTRTCQ